MLLAVFPTNFSSAQSQTKYKISGYVKDSNGAGVSGCNVIFNVPDIVPSVYSGAGGYYEIYAPAGTYHINVWPPFDGNYISYDEPSFTVTADVSNKNLTLISGYKISGFISDASGNPVVGACIFYGSYGSGWFSNSAGYYFLSAPAGTYTINAHPRSGYNYSSPTTNFTTYNEYNVLVNTTLNKNITVQLVNTTPTSAPTTTPAPSGTEIFKIESNSTWSNLYFNSTNLTLTFTVSGENGTTGYTKAYIAKTLVPTFTEASVSLDGKSTNFTVTDTTDYWVFEFTYHHSTHVVAIDLAQDGNPEVDTTNLLPSQNPEDISTIPELTPFALIGGLVFASVTVALTRKKFSQPLKTV